MLNATIIPSDVGEDHNRISDDDSIRNAQISSDSTDDLTSHESYQMDDEVDIETDSTSSNVHPFENLRVDDENNCFQNIPNYNDDGDDNENNCPNNALEQV